MAKVFKVIVLLNAIYICNGKRYVTVCLLNANRKLLTNPNTGGVIKSSYL